MNHIKFLIQTLKNIFTKSEPITDTDKVQLALAFSEAAQSIFINIDSELTKANAMLLEVIQESQEQLDKAQNVLDFAEEKLHQNNALKARLSEFVSK